MVDATCGLCARGARWIARADTQGVFRIVPVQSDLGAAMLRHAGLDPTDPASWLFLDGGRVFTSLQAVVRVGQRLGGVSRCLSILGLLPNGVGNRLYAFVARNRYRIMGRADLCSLPDPDVQKRILQ